MRKELFGRNQKTPRSTPVGTETRRAKLAYEVLLKEGHKTEFQLREAVEGIGITTFYQLSRGIFCEEPYQTLIGCHLGIWYTPQREHYDVLKGEWVLNKHFVEDTKSVGKTS